MATAQQRPKVGLALSGGGAKGFAHIGVLRVLDSLGIQVDYVAGTSMGAIVGGLYSIGYSPDMIAEEISSADWNNLLNPAPSRQYEPIGIKDESKRNLLTLGFSDWNVSLPSGLNNASKVLQKLKIVTQNYHGDTNFLKFPIGFVCIAADLNSGKEVVFTDGSLPDALRASMSIPSMFSPYRYRGKTLVDGGSINNFPTDKLKELGCDIIIGCDVQTTFGDSLGTPSISMVIEKTSMFMNFATSAERQALCDILVKPDMTGFGVTSFFDGEEIIDRGYQMAKNNMRQFDSIAHILHQFPSNAKPQYIQKDSAEIESISVSGLEWVSKSYITGTMAIDTTANTSINHLEQSTNALYGSHYFTSVTYDLVQNPITKKQRLHVRVKENKNDLDIGLGLHYDPDFTTSLLLNFTAFNALAKGSRLSADIIFSQSPRAKLLYEVDRGIKPGFGATISLHNTRPKFYIDKENQREYRYNDINTRIYTMFTLRNKMAVRIGNELNFSNYNTENTPEFLDFMEPLTIEPEENDISYDHITFFVEIEVDNLNKNNFPTRGQQLKIIGRFVNAQAKILIPNFPENFINTSLNYNMAISPNRWLTFLPRTYVGISFLARPTLTYSYNVGGLGRNYFNNQIWFYGFRYQQEIGLANIGLVGLDARAKLFTNNYITAGFNYAFTNSKLLDLKDLSDINNLLGFGAKYSINTFAGPLELSVHKNLNDGDWLMYLNFGFWF